MATTELLSARAVSTTTAAAPARCIRLYPSIARKPIRISVLSITSLLRKAL